MDEQENEQSAFESGIVGGRRPRSAEWVSSLTYLMPSLRPPIMHSRRNGNYAAHTFKCDSFIEKTEYNTAAVENN